MTIKIKTQSQAVSLREVIIELCGSGTPGLGDGFEVHISQNANGGMPVSLVQGIRTERSVVIETDGSVTR